MWAEGVDDDLLGALDLGPAERAPAASALGVLNRNGSHFRRHVSLCHNKIKPKI